MPQRNGAGRPRVPTEKKIIEGRFRPDRHPEPVPVKVGFPRAPRHLTTDEHALWKAFPRPVWITDGDRVAVEAAVCLYARVLANRRDQDGADSDRTMRLVDLEVKLWGRLLTVLSSLGLTPADRSKVSVKTHDAATNKDKWAGVL